MRRARRVAGDLNYGSLWMCELTPDAKIIFAATCRPLISGCGLFADLDQSDILSPGGVAHDPQPLLTRLPAGDHNCVERHGLAEIEQQASGVDVLPLDPARQGIIEAGV